MKDYTEQHIRAAAKDLGRGRTESDVAKILVERMRRSPETAFLTVKAAGILEKYRRAERLRWNV